MAAVTIHGDFGAQEEEICHYFHLFCLYLPCSNGARCHDLRVAASKKERAWWQHPHQSEGEDCEGAAALQWLPRELHQ